MATSRRVLIISYYWPPSAGAGVQRWLKFSKYLREYGWEPIVYTPENPEYPGYDHSLVADIPQGMEVLRRPIIEPYHWYKRFTGRSPGEKVQAGFLSEDKKPGRREKLAAWIRGNLFIPDARCWWIKPSVSFLEKWLRHNPVDAIVSSGPPHSMHLIGLKLKQKTNLPWLADFRDPWTQIDFYKHLALSARADRLHQRLEQQVLSQADRVISVSRTTAANLAHIGNRPVEVITNGFDPDDFPTQPPEQDNAFSLLHLGSMNADRNPRELWEVLAEKISGEPEFAQKLSIRLVGKTDISVRQDIENLGLKEKTTFVPYLNHPEALDTAGKAALLLLPLNRSPHADGIVTGKLFEYLALKRPILCIGPEWGDAAEIIKKCQSGYIAAFGQKQVLRQIIDNIFDDFCHNRLNLPPDDANSLMEYARPKLTEKLAGILSQMTR